MEIDTFYVPNKHRGNSSFPPRNELSPIITERCFSLALCLVLRDSSLQEKYQCTLNINDTSHWASMRKQQGVAKTEIKWRARVSARGDHLCTRHQLPCGNRPRGAISYSSREVKDTDLCANPDFEMWPEIFKNKFEKEPNKNVTSLRSQTYSYRYSAVRCWEYND